MSTAQYTVATVLPTSVEEPKHELVQHLFGYPGSLITISNVKMSKTNLDHPAYHIQSLGK
jgi:hypothetical protein